MMKRQRNKGRAMELTQSKEERVVVVSVEGRVAAGKPLKLIREVTKIGLPESIAASADTYVLRVEGDSMKDDQICDGDYIIVEKTDSVKDGDTIVAKLLPGEELTVKRYFLEESRVRLQPANESHEAQFYDEDKIAVAGLVVGLLRKYK